LAALLAFDWPGNIRELENALHRAILLGDGQTIRFEDLALPCAMASIEGEAVDGVATYRQRKRRVLNEFERKYLTELMTAHGGNVSQAGRAAGKERRDLGRLLKKHQLDRSSFMS